MNAYRVYEGDTIVYLMPYEGTGGRVVYRQDVHTYQTTRVTVGREEARTLRERGRSVPRYVTPAWADPEAPPRGHRARAP